MCISARTKKVSLQFGASRWISPATELAVSRFMSTTAICADAETHIHAHVYTDVYTHTAAAPACASASHSALPIPDPPPVTQQICTHGYTHACTHVSIHMPAHGHACLLIAVCTHMPAQTALRRIAKLMWRSEIVWYHRESSLQEMFGANLPVMHHAEVSKAGQYFNALAKTQAVWPALGLATRDQPKSRTYLLANSPVLPGTPREDSSFFTFFSWLAGSGERSLKMTGSARPGRTSVSDRTTHAFAHVLCVRQTISA